MTMIRVLIVDDRPSIRVGLGALFEAQPDLEVCGMASSGEGGLVLATTLDPDVVIMDLSMPGMGGLAATRAIRDARVPCQILVLSWHWSTEQVEAAMVAGASRFVRKSERPAVLLKSVRTLASAGAGPSEGPAGGR
ncbi:MAG: DNA-binding response regulator [Marmoricola sp.]|nr:DNA-binding response regulator [Marmoricola sp.]